MESIQSYCKTKPRDPAFDFYYTALEHYKTALNDDVYTLNVNLFNICLKPKYRKFQKIKRIVKKNCGVRIYSETDLIQINNKTFSKIIIKFGDRKFIEFLVELVAHAMEFDKKKLVSRIELLSNS